jgi:chromosome segregation ATPase
MSKLLIGVLALLVVLAGVNLYLALSQRSRFGKALAMDANQLTVLTQRMDSSDDRYAQLKGQFDVTSQKLGMTQAELTRARQLTATIQKQQRAAVQQLNTAIGTKASAQELNKFQSAANNKFGNLSGDIAGNKKDLQATKEALTGAKGELSGAIARTHDELVALAHRTDRDYFEFNLQRRHDRKKIGSIMIELLRTNRKQNLYTIDLFFDDKRTQRKDQALDQPVYFYVQGAPTALELVVNKLDKNRISGYISAPKGFFQNTPSVLTARPS